MKKIIIAGAGHGGLVAAYHLADKGYEVKVLEIAKKDELGYDWHDVLNFSAFDESDIPRPEENDYGNAHPSGFRNPSDTKFLKAPFTPGDEITMDRQVLIRYLAKLAQEKGVEIIYEAKACAAINEGEKVVGIRYEKDGGTYIEFCDMLIDAAGMNSPIRKSLPSSCGIEKELLPRDIFSVYRGYFNNKTGELLDPVYQIIFFNRGRPGIDWILTKEEYVDILIGKFSSSGPLTQQEVDETLDAMRDKFPFTGEELVRGGQICQIPIRRMLPVIVCDGYAAIGDSAGMTVPITGSGIVLSMKAGKILADTIIEAGDKELTKEILWKYEYEYFTKHGKELLFVDVLKNLFTVMDADLVDFMIEKEILTEKELSVGGGEPLQITGEYIKTILSALSKKPGVIPKLAFNLKSLPFLDMIGDQIPKEYDEKKVKEWAKKYSAL